MAERVKMIVSYDDVTSHQLRILDRNLSKIRGMIACEDNDHLFGELKRKQRWLMEKKDKVIENGLITDIDLSIENIKE